MSKQEIELKTIEIDVPKDMDDILEKVITDSQKNGQRVTKSILFTEAMKLYFNYCASTIKSATRRKSK